MHASVISAMSAETIATSSASRPCEAAIGELVAALDAHPEAGWAGAKLLDFRERDVIDGAGDVFTWAATGGRRGHGERDRGQYDEPRAIFGACGGAAVYRRDALDDVGAL